MTENYKFTSEDTQEKVRLNQPVEGLGLRNIQVRDEEDNNDSDGYGEVQLQKIQRTSSPSPSVEKYRDDRNDVEPDDVDFGLDLLINQKKVFTDEQLDEHNKPAYTSEGAVEPSSTFLPNLGDIMNNFGKKSEDEKSYRSESSDSSRASSRRDSPKSSGAQSKGWRNGDFRTNREAEYDRKSFIINAFNRLERRGVMLGRRFTMDSNLDDMEKEYFRLKGQVEMENAVMFMRESFLNVLNVLEYLNDKHDPFDIHLSGFTDHTYQNISRYDNVFEELYEKYHNKIKTPPEIRFLLMVGSSAVFYHMGHKMTEDEKMLRELKKNPEALRKMREMAGMEDEDDNAQTREFKKRKTEYEGQTGAAPQGSGAAQAAPVEAKDGFNREFIPPDVNRGGAMPGQKRPAPEGNGGGQRQMRGPQGSNLEDVKKRMREREAEYAKAQTKADSKNDSDSDSDKSETRTVRVETGRRGKKATPARRSMKI